MPHRCTVLLLGSVTAFQSMWIFMCHCFVQMYLQFPMDSLFQLMWEGKPPPRMFKSTSIIHVLKSHKERLLIKTAFFPPHCQSCYLKSLHEHVSQKSLPESGCGFRKADVQMIQFLPVDNLKEINKHKVQTFVQFLGISGNLLLQSFGPY